MSSFFLRYNSDSGSLCESVYLPHHLGSSSLSSTPENKEQHFNQILEKITACDKSSQVCFNSVLDTPSPLLEQACGETSAEELLHTPFNQTLTFMISALSNGSGGVDDYEGVLEAQGELEELQGGALWDYKLNFFDIPSKLHSIYGNISLWNRLSEIGHA